MKTFRYIVFIPVLILLIPVAGFILNLIQGFIPLLNDLNPEVSESMLLKIPFFNYLAVFVYAAITVGLIATVSLFVSSYVYPNEPSVKLKVIMIGMHLLVILGMFYYSHTHDETN
jgi:hypothetical protein